MQVHLIPYYGSTHSGPLGGRSLVSVLHTTPAQSPLHKSHRPWQTFLSITNADYMKAEKSIIHIYPTKLENLALEQIGLSDFMHKGQTLLSRIIGIASHTTISGTLPTLPNFSICECEFVYHIYNVQCR